LRTMAVGDNLASARGRPSLLAETHWSGQLE
jgi:hypothetical protein